MLKHLQSRVDKKSEDEIDLNLSHTSLHDLAQKLKISNKETYDYHHALLQRNHIKSAFLGGKRYIALEENGYAAAIDEFWLREGQRELNEKIYDKAKWMVPLLALVITAASLAFSAYTGQQTKKQIDIVKSDLQKLKAGKSL
jgi:hypothetical protein